MSFDPRLVACLIAGADTALSLTVTSQWVARRFGYSPRLGPPVYVASSRVQLASELLAILVGALALTSLLTCVESLSLGRLSEETRHRALPSLAVALSAALASLAAWEVAHAPLYGMAIIRWWRWWHGTVATGRAMGAATLMLWAGAERVFWTAMVLFPSVGAFAWFAWRVGRVRPVDGSRDFSRRAGVTTGAVASGSRSRRGGQAASDGVAVTEAGAGRRLILPDEILRMPAEEELLFVRGEAPVRARRLDYRTDCPWRLCDPAPTPIAMHVPDRPGLHAAPANRQTRVPRATS